MCTGPTGHILLIMPAPLPDFVLHTGPLAPSPEIFIKSLRGLLADTARPLSLDFISMYPFENRDDRLAYDEHLFAALFEKAGHIRPVFDLTTPFRPPGREDWESGLDEGNGEGLPFLVRRIWDALEDIHGIADRRFHGIDLLIRTDGSRGDELISRLAQLGSYPREAYRLIDSSRFPAPPSRFRLLPSAIWEEQFALFGLQRGGAGGTIPFGDPIEPQLDYIDELWTEYCRTASRLGFRVQRRNINRLRGRRRRENWPFIPIGQPAVDLEASYERLTAACDAVLQGRSEERWYGEFRLTLDAHHRTMRSAAAMGEYPVLPGDSPS